jgi:hypothetical protein
MFWCNCRNPATRLNGRARCRKTSPVYDSLESTDRNRRDIFAAELCTKKAMQHQRPNFGAEFLTFAPSLVTQVSSLQDAGQRITDSRCRRGDRAGGINLVLRDKQAVARRPHRAHTPRPRRSLRAVTRRQDQVYGSPLAVALALDLAAELLGEGVNQAAAEPGIGPSRIEPLAVVGDRQAKLARHPL